MALAQAFARDGINVLLADLAPGLPGDGAHFIPCDVTSQDQMNSLARRRTASAPSSPA